MLPTVIQTRLSIVPSLRRTLSDYCIRSQAKEDASTDMILHRRSGSTDLVLSPGSSNESSLELRGKLSLHGMTSADVPPLRPFLYTVRDHLANEQRLQSPSSLPC